MDPKSQDASDKGSKTGPPIFGDSQMPQPLPATRSAASTTKLLEVAPGKYQQSGYVRTGQNHDRDAAESPVEVP